MLLSKAISEVKILLLGAAAIVFNEKFINTDNNGIITGKLKIADKEAFLDAFAEMDDIIENIKTKAKTPNKTLP